MHEQLTYNQDDTVGYIIIAIIAVWAVAMLFDHFRAGGDR